MRKQDRILIALMVVFVFASVAYLSRGQREPMYADRPVIEWMNEGYPRVWNGPSESLRLKHQKANDAVMAIGTNAIAYYLSLMETGEDSRLKAQICQLVSKQHLFNFDFVGTWPYSNHLRRWHGSLGLEILGPEAKAAIPALTKMLNNGDEDQMGRAAYTLPAIGLEGIAPLTNRLADLKAKWRWTPVLVLGTYADRDTWNAIGRFRAPQEIEAAGKIIVPILIPCLNDRDPLVQLCAVQVLGKFGREPEIVVPAIIEILKSKRNSNLIFEGASISALAAFGPKAKAAVPDLVESLKSPNPDISGEAASALKAIDPVAANKAGAK